MTLATVPWYTSATLWTGIGVLVAVAAVGVTIILWRIGGPRRMLLYGTPVVTSLLPSDARSTVGGDIQVMFKGQPLTDPHLVTLVVKTRSRRDIANQDFNDGQPLVFNLGVQFVALLSDTAALAVDKLSVEDTTVRIGPCLMRSGMETQLNLLTDGPPNVKCESPLIDVNIYVLEDIGKLSRTTRALCQSLYLRLSLPSPSARWRSSSTDIVSSGFS